MRRRTNRRAALGPGPGSSIRTSQPRRTFQLVPPAVWLSVLMTASLVLVGAAPAAAVDLDCFRVSGVVRDALGNPVAGATVATSSTCSEATAITDNTGVYIVKAKGSPLSASASATASRLGMNPKSKTVGSGLHYSGDNDFTLAYVLTSSVAPSAFRPGASADLAVDTTAPTAAGTPQGWVLASRFSHPGTNEATGDWVVVSDGSSSGAAAQSAAPTLPTARFRRTFTSLATAPDGSYSVTVCAVPAGFTGSCADAAAAGVVVSSVAPASYAVDSTPPTLLLSSPKPLQTTVGSPAMTLTWRDPHAGIATAGARLWVDGAARPFSATGSQTFVMTAAAGGLAPGLHSVRAQVADLAGNQAERVFVFTVAALTADAADATVAEVTVPVNPGGTVPGPARVTFPAPVVDVAAFRETLSGTSWVGHSAVTRSAALGSVEVVFKSVAGVESLPQAVPVPAVSATHEVATAAPWAGPLSFWIPAAQVHLPDVVADVPIGFNAQGSTATLRRKSAALTVPAAAPGFLLGALPALSVISGDLSVCFTVPGTVSCNDDDRSEAQVAGWSLGVPVPALVDDSPLALDRPNCFTTTNTDCGGSVFDQHAAVRFSCPSEPVPGVAGVVNLCDGSLASGTPEEPSYLDAFVNAWLYADPDGGYPLWQQNHVDPGQGSPCPNGAAGRVTATLNRVASNAFGPLGGAPVVAGTFADSSALVDEVPVKLGATTGPDRSSVATQAGSVPSWSATGLGFRIEKDMPFTRVGRYQISATGAYDASGTVRTYEDTTQVGHMWQYTSGVAVQPTPVTADTALATATRFSPGATLPGTVLRGSLVFQAAADFSDCR